VLVVNDDDVTSATLDEELLKLDEVENVVTKLEFALKLVVRDENVDDTVELVVILVLVEILEVLKYEGVLPVEVTDMIDGIVTAETFMLGVATAVLVKSEVVFVEKDKTELEIDEVFAAGEIVAVELVEIVLFVMGLEVAGKIELELVVDVAFGTTIDTNRAPQTLPWLTAG